MSFLPLCKQDMLDRGWTQCDFVYVIGDAYVDHPSFGHAIISRVLEHHGFSVGIISQPNWRDPKSIDIYGRPRLGFLVSGGNMDSMVNHYSVSKRRRKTDAFTPGGEMGKRPDYATVCYCNLIRQTYKDVPILIGGIEASLRRLAHFDYWSESLKRSILLDSQADLLMYGMGEKSIVEIAEALNSGMDISHITYIDGTVFKTAQLDESLPTIVLPGYEELKTTSDLKGVFGLPEIHREEIKKATLLANPGCFVTGAILSGYPLSKAQLAERMIFDSKTGVSGAGVNPTTSTHYPNIGDNVNPYKVTSHRHMPEIQQELGLFSDVKVSFTPHLVPVIRGILTTNHCFLVDGNEGITSEEVLNIYKETYKGEPFIQILEDGEIPRLSSVRGSNYAQIGCFEIDETGRLVIISAIDNLVKGASGQAVHNMNIMCGFDEKAGLDFFGMHP